MGRPSHSAPRSRRFALEHRFDHIHRGESGFGKPEEQAYKHAMETLRGWPARDLDSRRTLNGRSWHHNGSASRRSGTTVAASAYPPTPQLAPTASFVASWNYCGSRTSWCASRAAVLLWFVAGNAASAQNAPGIRPPRRPRSRYIEAAIGDTLVGCLYMPNGNPAPGPLNSRYFRPVRGKETRARRWDLQFESTSLQRRVCLSSEP